MKYLPPWMKIAAQTVARRVPAENKLPFFTLSFTLAALILTLVVVREQQTFTQEAAEACPTEATSGETATITGEDTGQRRRTPEERAATRAAREERRAGRDGRSVTSVVTNSPEVNVTTIRTTEAPTIIVGGQGGLAKNVRKKIGRTKGQIVVKYKPRKSKRSIEEKVRKRKGRVKKRNQKLRLDIIQVPPNEEAATLRELAQDPNIEYAEQDVPSYGFAVPNDPKFAEQFALRNTGQPMGGDPGKRGADIDALGAWEVTEGNGVKIAILDTGIDQNHPELKSKIIASKDFSGKGSIADGSGHGTFIAGIIAAETNNGEGIAGVCPKCQLLVGKVLDDDAKVTSIEPIAAGVDWAIENGAKIINISFGQDQPSRAYEDIFKNASDKGVLIVASAGNCGGDNFASEGCNSKNPRTFPASYDYVLSVASTDNRDQKASSSSYGSWVDVAAPGYYIYTTSPLQSYTIGGSTKYTYVEGTSFASPVVAGIAGLLLSKDPNLSGQELRRQIESNVDKIEGTGNLWQYGRVNAAKAVGGTVSDDTGENTGSESARPNRDKTKKPCKPAKDKKTAKPTKTPKNADKNKDKQNGNPTGPLAAACRLLPNLPLCNGRKNKNCATNPSQTTRNRSSGSGKDGQATTSNKDGTVTIGEINDDETTNTTIRINGQDQTTRGSNPGNGEDINTGGRTGGNNKTEIIIDRSGGTERVDRSGGSNNQQNSSTENCPEASNRRNSNTNERVNRLNTGRTNQNSGSGVGSILCRYAPFLRRCNREEPKNSKDKNVKKNSNTKNDTNENDKKQKDVKGATTNKEAVLTYNALLSCLTNQACTAELKGKADLNYNNVVDQIDYALFIKQTAER